MSKKSFFILRCVVVIFIIFDIFLYVIISKAETRKLNDKKREYAEMVASDMQEYIEEHGEDAVYEIPEWLKELDPSKK